LRLRIENEFSGLSGGLYPVDAAVWIGDRLLAFIEVDGVSHYRKSANEKLRRRDELKQWLYRHQYPNVPMLRTRLLDPNEGGKELSLKIIKLLDK
jgi:hypothetical protein